jgi:hypothetical protein
MTPGRRYFGLCNQRQTPVMRTITLLVLFLMTVIATGCSNSGPSSSTEPVPRGNRIPTGTGPKAPR